MPYTKEEHQTASAKISRDANGKFVAGSSPSSSDTPKHSFFSNLFESGAKVGKTADDNTLIDVHVGNPLHKIIVLLQDIKKQKAFTFTLKGSLGIAGVALVVAGLGLFGGWQVFCNKGIQSNIGIIKTLSLQETGSTTGLSSGVKKVFGLPVSGTEVQRVILIKRDDSTIHLVTPSLIPIGLFTNLPVIASGDYNSCSQTLTIKDPSGIELLR